MIVLQTARLSLRQLTTADAPFILELVNDPDWLRFIGDRQIRTIADAEAYILNGPVKSYQLNGFGLWLVTLKEDEKPIGMCGLIKRDNLEDIDIGFAFLSAGRGQGYATEAAQATLDYARQQLQLTRILAIVDRDNARSVQLLEKIGLRFERWHHVPGDKKEICLMSCTFSADTKH